MLISMQTGSIVARYGLQEGYRFLKDCGFDAVDWSMPGWTEEVKTTGHIVDHLLEKDTEEILAALAPEIEAIRSAGLVIGQAHAPFPAYTTKDPSFLDKSIEIYKKCIEICHRVGCPYMVIHGIKTRKSEETPTVEEAASLNQKLFESLIPTLQKYDVIVCPENLFSGANNAFFASHCANAYEAIELIDSLNEKAGKEAFGLCLDTGHLHLARVDMRHYIPLLGKRIKVLHIDDNYGTEDSHRAPYGGNIRWDHFCALLKEIGYEGSLNFEIAFGYLPQELISDHLKFVVRTGQYFASQITKQNA